MARSAQDFTMSTICSEKEEIKAAYNRLPAKEGEREGELSIPKDALVTTANQTKRCESPKLQSYWRKSRKPDLK